MVADGAGIAVWIPPDAREEHEAIGPAPPGDGDGDPGRSRRAPCRVLGWVGEHEPPEPLLYLSHIGVAPERQGEGIGTALMHDGLASRGSRRASQPGWRPRVANNVGLLRAVRVPDRGGRRRARRGTAHLVHAPRSEAYSSHVTPGHFPDSTCSTPRHTVLSSFGKGVRDAQGTDRRSDRGGRRGGLIGVVSFPIARGDERHRRRRRRRADGGPRRVGHRERGAEGEESEGEESEGEESEEEESEGEDPAREAAEHVGAPVTEEAQGPITRAEARVMAPSVTAPGWAGELKLGVEDTWEPTIAADPTGPYLYVMYNRFGGPKACKQCPAIPMQLRVSSDNGVSWGPETYPCPCPGVNGFQYDPVVKVANNGVVYATWMNRYDMVFSKSTNHGATWTAPIEVSGQPWGDKPWIGVSPSGVDVYIAYATSSDVWIAASHNSGASFAARREAEQRQQPVPLSQRPRGPRERHRGDVGLELPGEQPAELRADRHRDVAHHERRHVVDPHGPAAGVQRRHLRDVVDDRARQRRGRHARGAVHRRDGAERQRSRLDPSIDRRGRHVGAGRRARRRHEPTRASRPSPEGRAASSGSTTATTGPARGTPGTGPRPTAGVSWSAETDISDADTGATYKSAAGFLPSTATTAPSTSRTPARPSRCGARA